MFLEEIVGDTEVGQRHQGSGARLVRDAGQVVGIVIGLEHLEQRTLPSLFASRRQLPGRKQSLLRGRLSGATGKAGYKPILSCFKLVAKDDACTSPYLPVRS